MKLKDAYSWKESYDQPRQHVKKQRHCFVNRVLSSQGYGSAYSHIWMWELDYKESWTLKNWCFWTVVLEKTLDSPLDCREIQPVHPKGDQSWVFIGRTDVEAETPILWPPDAKTWLIWKSPDAGKDWRQEERGTTEGEMAGWHHRLSGRGFGWTPGAGDGQGGLVSCHSWGRKELDTTEWLNWTELNCVCLKVCDTPTCHFSLTVRTLMFPHVSYSFFFIVFRHISFIVLNFEYWSPFPSPYSCLLAFLTVHSLT